MSHSILSDFSPIDLREVAGRWGTPLYVVSLDLLRAEVRRVRDSLSPAGVRLLYSLKTNYLPAITRTLVSAGVGVDVVSGYELQAALDAGFATRDIVFNGPVKAADELATAVRRGIYINVDAEQEIDQLCRLGREHGVSIPVGLRVYPPHDVYATDTATAMRHHPSKFGWPIENGDADRLADQIVARPELRLTGVHCHLGSQITSRTNLIAALGSVLDWTVALRQRAAIERINIGGGFGVPGIHRIKGAVAGLSEVRDAGQAGPAPEFDLTGFGTALADALRQRGLDNLTIFAEPGRALVSDSTLLLTRVAAVKRLHNATWVLLDGGLNLLPTAGVAERHRFQALIEPGAEPGRFMVGGPLCYEGDVFGMDIRLPSGIATGDLVAIRDAGAYGLTRATSFNRTRAAVAVLDGAESRLGWRRESYEDVMGFAVPEITA